MFSILGKAESFKACTARTLTGQGNFETDSAQSKFGGVSGLFDGTGDSVKITPTLIDLSADFTVECWVRTQDAGTVNVNNIIGKFQVSDVSDKSWRLIHGNFTGDSTPRLVWNWSTNGSNEFDICVASGISVNTWYHIAVARSGSTLKIFRDGNELISDTMSTSPYTGGSADLLIGQDISYAWNGHIDELRISTGARYTAGFTPSTSAFTSDAMTSLLVHFDEPDGTVNPTDDHCNF